MGELSDDEECEFFRKLESLQFPDQRFRELIPWAVQRWEAIGGLESVPWQWIMFLELCLCSFLVPTAVLIPDPGIKLYALIWAFILHPGSTGTSNAIRRYADMIAFMYAMVSD